MRRAVADIEFPMSGARAERVSRAEIIQREFAHDIARVTLPKQAPSFPNYRSNTPVKVTYGYEDDRTDFFGYIHHVEPALDRVAYMTVVCIGASYPLKQRRQHIYRAMTASDVAQAVADRHRLDADIDPHTLVRDVITQAGESDWELLVRLAREIGYVVYTNQTQLRFHPRTRDIDTFRSSAPRFRYETSESSIDQGDVRSFKSKIGETLPQAGRRADRRAFGVDPRSVDLISVRNNGELKDVLGVETADPFFDFYEQDLVIHSRAEGDLALDAITEDNRFHITAHADVRGNPRVRQSMPVYFDKLPQDYGGYWFVHSVKHGIEDEGYMMELHLGRDSLQVAADLPNRRPRRDLSFLPISGKRGGGGPRARRQRTISRRPGSVLRSPIGIGKRLGSRIGGTRKVPTTRTPIFGGGKVPSRRKDSIGRIDRIVGRRTGRPPRGSRYPTPPKPVRYTVPRVPGRAPVTTSKPPALWQATHRAQPFRTSTPQMKSPAVARRLSKVRARGR